MDLVNFMVNLFLAVLPNHLNVISASLAQVMFWAPLVIWAYVALGKDFARNHPFIVAGMLATGFAHITTKSGATLPSPARPRWPWV